MNPNKEAARHKREAVRNALLQAAAEIERAAAELDAPSLDPCGDYDSGAEDRLFGEYRATRAGMNRAAELVRDRARRILTSAEPSKPTP